MATFKSDAQGFLVGELVQSNRDILRSQQQGMSVWKAIRADVKSIARAMNVQVATVARVSQSSARAPSGPRVVATPAGRTSSSASRGGQSAASSRSGGSPSRSTAVAVPVQRAANGRFVAGQKRGGAPGSAPGGGGPVESGGGFKSLSESIGKLSGALSAADNMDPTVNAMKEVTDVVGPLGRGLFSIFGRTAERKKERWYTRILKALTPKKIDANTGNGGGSGGKEGGGFIDTLSVMFGGLLSRGLLPVIASIGAAIVAMAPVLGAALAIAVGAAVTAWLVKKALESTVVKEAKANYKKGMDDVTKPSFAPAGQVLDASGRDLNDPRRVDRKEAVGTDGRLINDPRRTDLVKSSAPLPPAKSISESVGRGVGHLKNGLEAIGFRPVDASNDPVARSRMTRKQREAYDLKQRSLTTGAQYSAGNISGLDDAQTRALVASTAMTESGGGNLGVVNSLGFMGRYQAGAGWLADAGLIKGGAAATKAAMKEDGFTKESAWGKAGGMTKFLKNDKNWSDGMSYDKYLGSASTQDAAFKTNSDIAYNQLMKSGTINASTPQAQVAGLLKARHIAGMGGAMTVARGGTGGVDANGTSAAKYYGDMVNDRSGLGASFRAGMPVAVNIPAIPASNIPSAVPATIPPVPDVQLPATPLNSGAGAGRSPVIVNVPERIGQNISDRGAAHVVTGGLGMRG